MTKTKEIGIVITAEASREDLEKKALRTIKPSLLAIIKKIIADGYKEKGQEGEVAVRFTITAH